jgi:hypothetical protein
MMYPNTLWIFYLIYNTYLKAYCMCIGDVNNEGRRCDGPFRDKPNIDDQSHIPDSRLRSRHWQSSRRCRPPRPRLHKRRTGREGEGRRRTKKRSAHNDYFYRAVDLPRIGLRLHGLRDLGDLYEARTGCSFCRHRTVGISIYTNVAGNGSRLRRIGRNANTPGLGASLTAFDFQLAETGLSHRGISSPTGQF